MGVKNPFGLRDGNLILIEDLSKAEKGLRCNCMCPACHEPFEARMGDIRRHHFAHSGEGCDEVNAYFAGLYMLLAEYLSSGRPLRLPPVIIGFDLSAHYKITANNVGEHTWLQSKFVDNNREIEVYPSKFILFDEAVIQKNSNGKHLAILCKAKGRYLAVRVTSPSTVCKTTVVSKFQNYPTIEIDLSEAADMIQRSSKEEFFRYLSNNSKIFKWIYNPVIEKKYPVIYSRSEKYYNAAQERMKKQAEERRTLEEKRKQEAEFLRQQAERARLERESRKEQETPQISPAELKKLRLSEGYEEVKDKFVQQHTQIRDKYDVRWVRCECCGKIAPDGEFGSYGGTDHMNLGKCRDCYRRK